MSQVVNMFNSNVFYGILVGRIRWPIHLGYALLLEENDDFPGTL